MPRTDEKRTTSRIMYLVRLDFIFNCYKHKLLKADKAVLYLQHLFSRSGSVSHQVARWGWWSPGSLPHLCSKMPRSSLTPTSQHHGRCLRAPLPHLGTPQGTSPTHCPCSCGVSPKAGWQKVTSRGKPGLHPPPRRTPSFCTKADHVTLILMPLLTRMKFSHLKQTLLLSPVLLCPGALSKETFASVPFLTAIRSVTAYPFL